MNLIQNYLVKPIHPLNIHEASVYASEINSNIGVSSLVAMESEEYTQEMRNRALDRSKRTLEFMLAILNEQIAELDESIKDL